MNRKCVLCIQSISECMGFVVAGDFIKATAKQIPWIEVREVCGRCVLKEGVLDKISYLN